MDLKDLTPNTDDVVVNIVHPVTQEQLKNDDGSDMTITMYAPYSKEYKAALHEQTNKRLKQVQNKKKFELSAEDLENSTIELLAKATKSWNITFGSKCPSLSVDEAKEIYTQVFWIRDQLEDGMNNSLVFMRK